MKASIIIPTYNRRDTLKRVLDSLFNQTYPKDAYEVVVIDDGSTDNTGAMVKKLNAPCSFKYFWQEKNGPAAARNYGLSEAQGEVIIFIDSDIIVGSDFIEEHLSYHKKHDRVIVRAPVIRTQNRDNPIGERMKLTDLSSAFFATGNTSVKKSFLFQAGPFDEDFKEYGWEDLEMGERLKKLGLSVKTNKRAVGYHYQKKLHLADLPRLCAKEETRGRTAVIFYRKHPTSTVKYMTQINSLFFFLDWLLSVGNLMNTSWGKKFLIYLDKNNCHLLLSFFMKIIAQHSYIEGIKEALKKNNKE